MLSHLRLMGILIISSIVQTVFAVSATSGELAEARRWSAAKFEGVVKAPAAEEQKAGLIVLANNDAVQLNSRNGKPMKIVSTPYTRGLYCHAVSKIVVRLPEPAKEFSAMVGVDNNEQTGGGAASVIFSVTVNNIKAFTSPVMKVQTPAVPISVKLGGATEFILEVSDAGDGINCDQSDWADAKVILDSGKTLWLADLPIFGAQLQAYNIDPIFSFNYDGKPSSEILKNWKCERSKRSPNAQKTEHTIKYTDPETGLVLRFEGIQYNDFPTVEWVMYFKNTSNKDTPILSDIQTLDMTAERMPITGPNAPEFILHHNVGSICAPNDYQPLETVLTAGLTKRISAAGGRPTNSDMAYFNLEWPTNEGVIIAVGWSGQWASQFIRDKDNHLHVVIGQELTHFKLLPGEEVRTPRIVMQFWKADRVRSQNTWRRWMMAHNMPKPGGKLPPPILLASSSALYGEMVNANEENQIMNISRYCEEKIPLTYWWMDAGWYIQQNGWGQVGTWEVDPKRFPRGLRAVSDFAHSKGVKTLLWFEPERVTANT